MMLSTPSHWAPGAPRPTPPRWLRLSLCAALAVAIASWLAASSTTTAAQRTTASRAPQRIVSLVPALTEMMFAIGAGPQVVAVSSFDHDPPQVRSLPRVGALLDPDVERIIALRADLVLLYGSQTDLMMQLRRASMPYYEYRHGGLGTVTSTLRELGERAGHGAAADRLADVIEQRLDAVRRRTAGQPRPRTLLVFGRERGSLRNIYASGGRGFLHDMLEAAGGDNVFADIQAESVQASSELILARAPEVILEIRALDIPADEARAAEMSAWRALASLPAVRRDRLHLLPGRWLVVPGPRVADGVETMAAALHDGRTRR